MYVGNVWICNGQYRFSSSSRLTSRARKPTLSEKVVPKFVVHPLPEKMMSGVMSTKD